MRTAQHISCLVPGKSKDLCLPSLGRHGLRLEIGQSGETTKSGGAAAEAVARLKRRAHLYHRLAQISEAQMHRSKAKSLRSDGDTFN